MHPALLILLELAALCVACLLLIITGDHAAWGSCLLALGLILYHGAQLVEMLSACEDY